MAGSKTESDNFTVWLYVRIMHHAVNVAW